MGNQTRTSTRMVQQMSVEYKPKWTYRSSDSWAGILEILIPNSAAVSRGYKFPKKQHGGLELIKVTHIDLAYINAKSGLIISLLH